jgi:dihydrofolate reductase
MQTLTVDFIMSLDGYGAAEGWPGFWGMEGPEYLGWLEDSPEKDYPVLMGATTYQVMYGLVKGGEPGTESMDAMPKFVFSSTMDRADWTSTTLVTTDAVQAVRELKESSTLPLRTLGSVSLCRSLVNAGLVDRIRTVIFPVITGATGSDPVFGGYPDVRLDLVENRLFDGRIQLLEYAPTVLDRAPLAD